MARLKLMLVAVLLAACTGCALRQSSSTYRLSEINSQYFLLSPDAAASQLHISRKAENQKDCSIKGPWFSFYPAPGNKPPQWIAETPSAAAWERSSGAVDMMDQWQGFQSALYGLQQRHCFASLDEYLSAKQRIAASLSPPAGDTLYYRYGFGPGGYVDLGPGMQLRIERDFFGARSTDYQGTTITNYEISGNDESGIAIRFLGVEKRSGSTTPVPTSSDAGLATQFATAPRLRLFLLNLVVSSNAKAPAILIGASSKEDLNAPTQAIESDPAISCSGLQHWPVTCALFDGSVTVSPMLEVFVNGAPTYVPIGSRLWAVLPHLTDAQQAKVMRTLRLHRRFQGKLIDVKFPPDSNTLAQLLLFGGDRVSWSKN